ncbi:hypothetical protein Q0N71_31040 [Bacillus thuringiensis]|uniref:hypothetical protein n=1 Tax=Bacillus thuringiensis TaxID=1428 RepID=UPI00345A3BEB
MLHKKKIIIASVLSFGLSMGVSVAQPAFAAPTYEKLPSDGEQVKTNYIGTQEFKILNNSQIFQYLEKTSWEKTENIEKLQGAITYYDYNNVVLTNNCYIDLKVLLKNFNVDSEVINIFSNLSKKEQDKLTKNLQKKTKEILSTSINNRFGKSLIVFHKPVFKETLNDIGATSKTFVKDTLFYSMVVAGVVVTVAVPTIICPGIGTIAGAGGAYHLAKKLTNSELEKYNPGHKTNKTNYNNY